MFTEAFAFFGSMKGVTVEESIAVIAFMFAIAFGFLFGWYLSNRYVRSKIIDLGNLYISLSKDNKIEDLYLSITPEDMDILARKNYGYVTFKVRVEHEASR